MFRAAPPVFVLSRLANLRQILPQEVGGRSEAGIRRSLSGPCGAGAGA